MTDLSPAAQATWVTYLDHSNIDETPADLPALAAAIEALADQADPKRHIEDISYQHQMYADGWKDCLEVIRNIAAELRGKDQPSSGTP